MLGFNHHGAFSPDWLLNGEIKKNFSEVESLARSFFFSYFLKDPERSVSDLTRSLDN